jgi:hypothetical protein
MEVVWAVLIIQAFVCGFLSSHLAENKGYSSVSWFAYGLFFGILGLIAAAGLPLKSDKVGPSNIFTKMCPDCSENINRDASVCKYCGYRFSNEQLSSSLVEALSERSPAARLKAVEAITIRKDKSLFPHLVKAFKLYGEFSRIERDADDILQERIKNSLIDFGDSSIIPQIHVILEKAGKQRNPKFRTIRRSLEILSSIKDPASVQVLIDLLQNRALRKRASEALTNFGEVAIPDLNNLLKSGNRSDRKIAKRVLDNIRRGISE